MAADPATDPAPVPPSQTSSSPKSSSPSTQSSAYNGPNAGLLRHAHGWLKYLGIAYAVVLVLLMVPFFQMHAVYMHFVRWPLFADFAQPVKYGLSAHKALNLQLTTSDNITLGAWLVLSDSYIRHTSPLPTLDSIQDHVPKALASHPTALFFHGNAASRAVPYRVHHVQTWSSRMGCNALIIDYRGFGDSSGTPSEEGLNRDAWAAYTYLLEHGAQSKDVLVVGHSLGTAVATRFVKEVEEGGGEVKGLVLQAPFSSLKVLVDTYYLLGVFPLMKPLDLLPGVQKFIKAFLAIKYDTAAIIGDIKTKILIAHAEDDWDIPHAHTDVLFDSILSPHLPPPPPPMRFSILNPPGEKEYGASQAAAALRLEKRGKVVRTREVEKFGSVEETTDGRVRVVKSRWGGHDPFGNQEGVQDAIREHFGLWP